MDANSYIKIIEAATKKPKIQFDDDYINAQLDNPLYNTMLMQAGPKCTLNCSHCYGDYGPHFKEVPSKEVVDITVNAAKDYGIDGITLSDGEPIMDENKYFLSQFIGSGIPLNVITNSTFAYSHESLKKWASFFKKNGLSFDDVPSNHVKGRKGHTRFTLSQNDAYPLETIKASPRILEVFHDFFGLDDVRDYVQLYFTWGGGKNGIQAASKLIKTLQNYFSTESFIQKENVVLIETGDGRIGTIEISGGTIRPSGKGISFLMKSGERPKTMVPEKMVFYPDEGTRIHIDHKGDAAYGTSGSCIKESRIKGSILRDSITDIISKIQEDPVYWAFQVGGARFLYYLARLDDLSYSIAGLEKCHGCQVCNDIFGNSERIAGIRKRLGRNSHMKQKIAEHYLDFGKLLI